MKKSKITCNSCGYPLNDGDRRYCKVCGNNLRENKKVSFNILKPTSIVATVLCGVAVILALIGLFGGITQTVYMVEDGGIYSTVGVKWFFCDGWKALMNTTSVDRLIIDGTKFGIEFATYVFALGGTLILLFTYIQSLIRRAICKHTNFCIGKFFKFAAIFLLPYVFAINFFEAWFVSTSFDDYWYVNMFGWGILLIIIALVVIFAARCFAHIDCPHKKEEKAPFALKSIATAFMLIFVIVGFTAAVATNYYGESYKYIFQCSVYDYIELFILDKSMPIAIGASFFTLAGLAGACLVLALAFIFTKNNTRKIIYSGILVALAVASSVVSYYGAYGFINYAWEGYPVDLSKMSFVSCVYINIAVFALISLALSIIYRVIVFNKEKKQVK